MSSQTGKSNASKTSSQRQKELLIAKHKREELERQSATSLRLTKQKQQMELQQLEQEKQRLQFEQELLQREQALRLEELEEANRQKIAEAKLTELELTEDFSECNEELKDTLSHISRTSQDTDTQRISEWVQTTSSGANIPARKPLLQMPM